MCALLVLYMYCIDLYIYIYINFIVVFGFYMFLHSYLCMCAKVSKHICTYMCTYFFQETWLISNVSRYTLHLGSIWGFHDTRGADWKGTCRVSFQQSWFTDFLPLTVTAPNTGRKQFLVVLVFFLGGVCVWVVPLEGFLLILIFFWWEKWVI